MSVVEESKEEGICITAEELAEIAEAASSSSIESEGNNPHTLVPLNKTQDLSRKSPPRLAKGPGKCLVNLTMDESLHKKYGSDQDAKARRAERIKKRVDNIENLSVSFDRVVIREYPICLGNNPSVSRGPPLSIDWDPMTHLEFDFVQLHDSKMPSRGQAEMFVPLMVRERMLKNAGYSRKEIMKTVKDVNISRIQRRKTIANLKYHKLELGMEKFKKKFSKVFHSKVKDNMLMEWSSHESEYYANKISPAPSVASSYDGDNSISGDKVSVKTADDEDAVETRMHAYVNGDEKDEFIS